MPAKTFINDQGIENQWEIGTLDLLLSDNGQGCSQDFVSARGGRLNQRETDGQTALEIVLAHSLVQFVVLLVQTFAMLLVMCKIFDSPFIGDFYWTTGLLLLQGLCGMCYGMVWPQEGMHPVLRSVGWLLPLSFSTKSIRSLTARGWGIRHRSVYYGYISTAVWIVVFLVAITIVIRIKKGIRTSK